MFNLVNAYRSQVVWNKVTKREFWEECDFLIISINK